MQKGTPQNAIRDVILLKKVTSWIVRVLLDLYVTMGRIKEVLL